MPRVGSAARRGPPLVTADMFERPPPKASTFTLERIVEDPRLGGLPISPAQRAMCRACDGLPVTHLDEARVEFHFGHRAEVAGPTYVSPDIKGACVWKAAARPRVVVVRSGVRGGKSLIAAFGLILDSLTCELRRKPEHDDERPEADGLVGVRSGELLRAVIVAPRLSLGRAPFHHLVGALKRSPVLSKYIVPGRDLAESITLRRDDGAEVLVEMVAASSGGTNLRSTWLTSVLFDEADFHDSDGAVVNLREQVQSVRTRILKGGRIWVVSSPWDDSSEFAKMHAEAYGKVYSADDALADVLAFHSDSLSMNPTLDRRAIDAERKRDPENAAREYDAVPLSSSSLAFFPKALIDAAMTAGPDTLEPNGAPHYGGTDLGFRKNSSAVAFCRWEGSKVVLAYYDEKIPAKGQPLKPSEVCKDFGEQAIRYKCQSIRGDGIYRDTAEEHLGDMRGRAGECVSYDTWHPTVPATAQAFSEFRNLMAEGKLELPNDPRIRKQLEDTRVAKAQGGGTRIILPKHGAAHGDVLMAIVLAAVQVPANDDTDDDGGEWGGAALGGTRRW